MASIDKNGIFSPHFANLHLVYLASVCTCIGYVHVHELHWSAVMFIVTGAMNVAVIKHRNASLLGYQHK